MTVIYVLIPVAIILTLIGIYMFFWAVKSEQFTDLEKQGLSILFDEDEQNIAGSPSQKEISDNLNSTNKVNEEHSHQEKTPSSNNNKSISNK